jgi:hypothetical protein
MAPDAADHTPATRGVSSSSITSRRYCSPHLKSSANVEHAFGSQTRRVSSEQWQPYDARPTWTEQLRFSTITRWSVMSPFGKFSVEVATYVE